MHPPTTLKSWKPFLAALSPGCQGESQRHSCFSGLHTKLSLIPALPALTASEF